MAVGFRTAGGRELTRSRSIGQSKAGRENSAPTGVSEATNRFRNRCKRSSEARFKEKQ